MIVHEVLGVDSPPAEESPWVAAFEAAVQNYTDGRLDEAEQLFRQTIKLRNGPDGPAEFYLKQITVARQGGDIPDQPGLERRHPNHFEINVHD